jgi:hypothetical protein
MFDIQEVLKDGKLSQIIEGVGKVANVFSPAVGGALMMASNITDAMDDVDDDLLENRIVGLNGSALILENMVENRQFDRDKLLAVAHNLKSISKHISKTQKMIS